MTELKNPKTLNEAQIPTEKRTQLGIETCSVVIFAYSILLEKEKVPFLFVSDP